MANGFDKFLNIMKLNDPDESDDEFEDDLLDNDDGFEEKNKKSIMGSFFKKDNSISDFDDEEEIPEQKNPFKPKTTKGRNNLVQLNSTRGNEVFVIRPQEFSEAQHVADYLKSGKTIVINMEGIDLDSAQRIIDFIGGASYALDGTIQAISNNIFIVAPNNIEVTGDFREEILNDNMLSPDLGKY